MAYVLTIKAETKQTNNNLGDVVAIQDVKPSEIEYQKFTVHEIKALAKDLHAERNAVQPEIKQMWKDGDDWKELATEPAFRAKYDGLKFEHTFKDMPVNQTVKSKDIAIVKAMETELAAAKEKLVKP